MEAPAPYTARAARLEDADAVTAAVNDNCIALFGEPFTTPEELLAEWRRPGRDLDATSRIVEAPDGRLAACLFLDALQPFSQPLVWGEIVPEHRGHGLGSALADWAEAQARRVVLDAPADAQTVLHWPAWVGETGLVELLRARGFTCVRHFWRMDVDLAAEPAAPEWPPGIAVRTFRRGEDERATYDAVRESFADHWGDDHLSFAQWQHERIAGAGSRFDPDVWFLATDGDEIAGVALCTPEAGHAPELGYVSTLGVRPAWRRRGLARALLLHVFASFRARGRSGVSLHVDAANPTGALALYEGVGMTPLPRFEIWEKPLPR